MKKICRRLIPLLGSLLLMTACTAHQPPTGNPEFPYPPTKPPVVGDILHVPSGLYVSEAQMLQVVTDSRLVYVGETHDNPASHRLELTVLRGMADRWPGQVALGMEMFTPAQQEILDRWTAGEMEEKEFLRESQWFQTWRMDFDYYRDLLLFARDQRIPVIGLNAGKEQVNAVSKTELAALPTEERQALPEMDLADPYQRELVHAIFGGHAHGENGLAGFLRVQTLWDETMAENIAGYLRERPEMRMVVVAGSHHVRYGFGIPRRVFRRLPTSHVLVGSQEIGIPPEKQDRLMDVEIPAFPMAPYDFLAYTAYESLQIERVLLGIQMDETGGRVRVQKVIPASVAERAGIQGEDIIVAFDGEPVRDSFDVVYAVRQKHPGDRSVLRLDRRGATLDIEVVFEAAKEMPHGRR